MTRTETTAPATTTVIVDADDELFAIEAAHAGMQDYDSVRDARGAGSTAAKVALILAGNRLPRF